MSSERADLVLRGPPRRRWRARVEGAELVVGTDGGSERRTKCRDEKAARARLTDAVRQMRALGYEDAAPEVEVVRLPPGGLVPGASLELRWGEQPTAFDVLAHAAVERGVSVSAVVVRHPQLGYVRFAVLLADGGSARVVGGWGADPWGTPLDARAEVAPAGVTPDGRELVHARLCSGLDTGREGLVYTVLDAVLALDDDHPAGAAVVLARQRDFPEGMGHAFLVRLDDAPTRNERRAVRGVGYHAVFGPERCRFEVREDELVLEREALGWDAIGRVFR